MKNIVITLSVFVLILSGCKQETKAQTEVTDNEFVTGQKKYFITESDWKGVKCREYQEDDGFHNIQECIFPKANLKQVYDIVKKIDPNLKSELPSSNLIYSLTENDCKRVEYDYLGEKKLLIRLVYNEGITYIEINQKKNETQTYIIYSGRDIF